MNWGYKILFLYTGFVLFVLVLVILAYRQDVALVTDDYYQKELKYQEEIDRLRNARSLKEPLSIEYKPTEKRVYFIFPAAQTGKITGEIQFMRPSDPRKDVNFEVRLREDLVQVISTGGMQKGYWKLKIYWEQSGVKYLEEKDIILQ